MVREMASRLQEKKKKKNPANLLRVGLVGWDSYLLGSQTESE